MILEGWQCLPCKYCQCMLSHCYDNVKWDSLNTTPDSFTTKRRPLTTHTLVAYINYYTLRATSSTLSHSQIYSTELEPFFPTPSHSLSVHLDRVCVYYTYIFHILDYCISARNIPFATRVLYTTLYLCI